MRAAERFERALCASARRAGAPIAIASHAAREWRSATFSGARHVVEACGTRGEALDAWLATLADTELTVPGHVVAELRVDERASDGDGARFRLEGVTVALG
ncbi:hypothetical protein [uncultured Sphingomonas sp.]|uniref:hypothetical protein n=1 Tax=uncultured Sphingomonas sp. TaxID=158754 RepID=UPI0025E990AF|nr:hypothetical protein [uncultured Sphingomonas sp.]